MPSEPREFPGDSSHERTAIAPHPRGFRIAHGMLLVAAVALGFVSVGNTAAEMRAGQFNFRHPANGFVLASSLLMPISLALFAVRLLRPRPPLADIFRQPGFTANWVMAFFGTINMITILTLNYERILTLQLIRSFDYGYFWPVSSEGGGGVAIAWLTLALSGSWRSEPGWLDRAGRALGVFWISAFVAYRTLWHL